MRKTRTQARLLTQKEFCCKDVLQNQKFNLHSPLTEIFFFFPLQASFRKVFKEVAVFQAQSGGGEAESNTSSVCFKYIGTLGSCIVVSLLQSPVGKEL